MTGQSKGIHYSARNEHRPVGLMSILIMFVTALIFATPAWSKESFPSVKARFLTKNVWKGTVKLSEVNFYCFMSECTWKEVEIDQCFLNTTQLFLQFSPSVYSYSTSGDSHSAEKMSVKTVSKDVYSVALEAGRNTKAEYVIKLRCPDKGQLAYPGCQVQAVSGSMIDINSERTTYDLVDASSLKDLKLERCQ